jgi:hypothetical protein
MKIRVHICFGSYIFYMILYLQNIIFFDKIQILSLFILIIINIRYAFEFLISKQLRISLNANLILLLLVGILIFVKITSVWINLLQLLLSLYDFINVVFVLLYVLLNIIWIKPYIWIGPYTSISLLVSKLDFDLIGLFKPIANFWVLSTLKFMGLIIIVVSIVHSFPLLVQHVSLQKFITFKLYFPFYVF